MIAREPRAPCLRWALLAFRAAGHWRRNPRQPAFLSDVEAHRAADSQEPAPGKRPNLSLFLRLQTARSPDAQHKPPAFPRGAPTTIGHHSNWRKTLSDRTISQSPGFTPSMAGGSGSRNQESAAELREKRRTTPEALIVASALTQTEGAAEVSPPASLCEGHNEPRRFRWWACPRVSGP